MRARFPGLLRDSRPDSKDLVGRIVGNRLRIIEVIGVDLNGYQLEDAAIDAVHRLLALLLHGRLLALELLGDGLLGSLLLVAQGGSLLFGDLAAYGGCDEVEDDDVLSPDTLQRMHDISLYFADKPWVEKVASLTTLNIPRRVKGAPEEDDGSLDDLDGLEEVGDDDEGDLDDLDSLDDLDDLDEEIDPQGDLEDAAFNALLDIIESDPERFPGGIAEVGPALSAELQTDPIVEGAEVTDEEASELANAIAVNPLLVGRLIDDEHLVTPGLERFHRVADGLGFVPGVDEPGDLDGHG